MHRSRTDKIFSLLKPNRERNHTPKLFKNQMCNVSLSPVRDRILQKKIVILSDVKLATSSENICENQAEYSMELNENIQRVDGIEQSYHHERNFSEYPSDKSSTPPDIEFSDFEISSSSEKNVENVFNDHSRDLDDVEEISSNTVPHFFNEKGTSSSSPKVSYQETHVAVEQRLKISLRPSSTKPRSYQTETDSEDGIFSSFDDSDGDPSYSPTQCVGKRKRRGLNLLATSSDSSGRNSSRCSQEIKKFSKKSFNGHGTMQSSNGQKDSVNSSNTTNKSQDLFTVGGFGTNNNESDGIIQRPEQISVKTDKRKIKKVQRKPDFCYFCEEEILNFARHIQRNHSLETEVKKIMSLKPKSVERRNLIDRLRKEGNYLKNVSGYYKPVRSPQLNKQNVIPCSKCHGFYSSKSLYRHSKRCFGENRGYRSKADSQSSLASLVNKKTDIQLREQVFPRMRADKISLEAKKDPLICAFGARYLKTHRDKHFIPVTSRKMRELSRLLLLMKEKEPSIVDLFGALKPEFFELFVETTKHVAQYDKDKDVYNAPTYGMNIATSLKQCCDIALTLFLTKTNVSTSRAEVEANLKNMIHLFNANWKFEVSSQAGRDLHIKKWNKVTIVPLADDLKKLKEHLIESAKSSIDILLKDKENKDAFTVLLETIYCRVILLNRKRPGELERLTVHTYTEFDQERKYDEFDSLISQTEKILLHSFRRVVTRGKRGRGVPVLFSGDVQENIGVLLKMRPRFVPENNPYLFGRPGFLTPITGYKVLEKYARSSGAKNPSSITCTKLRKHLATLSQLFSMKENEIDQLATFMGHTIGVHKNSYRLPDDIHQVAKISKLLVLLEGGATNEFKGKTLDEIDVKIDEDLLDEADAEKHGYSDEEEVDSNNDFEYHGQEETGVSISKNENISTEIKKKGRKRVLVPWTEQQKRIVKAYFSGHIENKKPPKRSECDELYERYPGVFKNKEWTKIKVYVQNIYSKN